MEVGAAAVFVSGCSHTLKFFDPDAGEEVCGGCGVVLNQKMEDLDIRAIGQVIHYHPLRDTHAFITARDRDANGNSINKHAFSYNMRALDRMTVLGTVKQKNLHKAMEVLDMLATTMSLPNNVVERAAYVYNKALDADFVRGRSIAGIMGACVYIGCRDCGMPATIKNVIDALGSSSERDGVADYYRLLMMKLDLHPQKLSGKAHLSLIAQKCGMSVSIVRRAAEMVEKAEKHHLSEGKTGLTLAAAALYIAEGGKVHTYREIAEAAELSTLTVRKRSRDLSKILDLAVEPVAIVVAGQV